MLVVPRDGDATLVVPRLEAPRVVERPDVFALRAVGRDRGSDRDRRRPGGRRRDRGDRRPHVGPVPRRPAAGAARRPRSAGAARSPGRSGRSRTPPRSRRCAPRPRRPTGSPRSCRAARSRWSAAPRPRCRPTSARRLLAEGHHRVNFAIVAAGENAASPHHEAGRPGDRARARSCCATSAARCSPTAAPATAPTSPAACTPAEPPAEVAEVYAVLHDGPGRRRCAAATVGTPVRGGRRRRPRRHHRGRLRRPLHPPHRPRHRRRGARGPLHRRAATRRRWRPATRSRSSPASTSRAAWGLRLEDIVVARGRGPRPAQPASTTTSSWSTPDAGERSLAGALAGEDDRDGLGEDREVGEQRPVVDVVEVEAGVVLEGRVAAGRSPATCR